MLINNLADSSLVRYMNVIYMNIYQFKSTTGFCYMINEAPVSWTSKWQSITAQLTTESEYIALSKAEKQAVWLHHLLYALQKSHVYTKKLTLIYANNQDSIDLSVNLVFHSQIKHIQVQYHAIQEYIENDEIRIQFLSTNQMLADSLIKKLDHVKFAWMIEELDLSNWYMIMWKTRLKFSYILYWFFSVQCQKTIEWERVLQI